MDTVDDKRHDLITEYYVVSDRFGFVGAYSLIHMAENIVIKYYPTPFIIQRFPANPNFPTDVLWALPFQSNDSVAFVSNSKDEVLKVQSAYGRIGLMYDDDIKYWEHAVNVILPAAKDRLLSISRAYIQHTGGETMETLCDIEFQDLRKLEQSFAPLKNGPLSQLLKSTETITIMDCVIPVGVGGFPEPESKPEPEEKEKEPEPKPEPEEKEPEPEPEPNMTPVDDDFIKL